MALHHVLSPLTLQPGRVRLVLLTRFTNHDTHTHFSWFSERNGHSSTGLQYLHTRRPRLIVSRTRPLVQPSHFGRAFSRFCNSKSSCSHRGRTLASFLCTAPRSMLSLFRYVYVHVQHHEKYFSMILRKYLCLMTRAIRVLCDNVIHESDTPAVVTCTLRPSVSSMATADWLLQGA